MGSLCSDNMIGYRKFCVHKTWKIIRKLLETMNSFKRKYNVSDTLYLQIFSLLSCFNLPASFEKWKSLQWDVMFKNVAKLNQDSLEDIAPRKKMTISERKRKQKQDEKNEQSEYKKTV